MLAMAFATTSPLASGPQEPQSPFVDEIDFDDIVAGNLPGRLRSHDMLSFVVFLVLAEEFDERHRSLLQPKAPLATWDDWRRFSDIRYRLEDEFAAAGRQTDFGTDKYVERQVSNQRPDGSTRTYTVSRFVRNCQEDAFRTALRTLRDRKARYGAKSPEFSRWVDAQVKVFDQCGGRVPFEPPEDPGSDWGPLEQHDRQYQIAAAYFYNGQYLEAASRFDAIARTADSPWRDLGRYLVPRSLAREAIVNEHDPNRHLELALGAYRDLASDPDFVADFPSVPGLIQHLEAHRDPIGARRELERRIHDEPAQATEQDLKDFRYLHLRRNAWSVDADATAYERWRNVLETGSAAAAVDHWRVERSLPGLYLALVKAHSGLGTPALSDLAQAAEAIEQDMPGYFNVLLHRIRILGMLGEVSAALSAAEQALSGTLSGSQGNRLRLAAAEVTPNWHDYFRWASIKPLRLPWTDAFARSLPSNYNRITTDTSLFAEDAVAILNSYFTPSMLLDVIDTPGLSGYQRGRIAIAAWTKAMLADDLETALQLAAHIRRHVPVLVPEFELFEEAEDKQFEAARIIFDYPAFSPWMWSGPGRTQRYRTERDPDGRRRYVELNRPLPDHVAGRFRWSNWWCADRHDDHDMRQRRDEMTRMLQHPRFSAYSAAELAAIGALLELRRTAATTTLGPHVIRYAEENLNDRRVPRTLHRLVFATRHACFTAPGEISQSAYALLHEHFPDSEWATKTPYWYSGTR